MSDSTDNLPCLPLHELEAIAGGKGVEPDPRETAGSPERCAYVEKHLGLKGFTKPNLYRGLPANFRARPGFDEMSLTHRLQDEHRFRCNTNTPAG